MGHTTDDETPRPKIRGDGIDTWSAWRTNIPRDLAPYVLEDDEPDEARAEQTSLVGQSEPRVSRTEEDMEGTPLSRIHLACAQIALLLYERRITGRKTSSLSANYSR